MSQKFVLLNIYKKVYIVIYAVIELWNYFCKYVEKLKIIIKKIFCAEVREMKELQMVSCNLQSRSFEFCHKMVDKFSLV